MVRYAGRTFFAALALTLTSSLAQADDRLTVAVGVPGSDSFIFGTELWAMSEFNLAPSHGIALTASEVAEEADRLDLLHDSQVQAAIVRVPVPALYADNTRAIMALWPEGVAKADVAPARLLVRRDVDDDVIYSLTKAIFEHADYMKTARATLGIGLPEQALTGLDVPIHPGAYRYYQERGIGRDAASSPTTESRGQNGGTETFRDFNDAKLNGDEIEQIIAACRHALDLGSLSAVLGDLSSAGCEVYQSHLVDQPGDGQTVQGTATNKWASDDEHGLAAVFMAAQNATSQSLDLSGGQGGPVIPVRTSQPRYDARSPVDRRESAEGTRQPIM